MRLSDKRVLFTTAQSRLILFANQRGYRIAGGYWFRCDDCPVGKKNSCHKSSLAIDFVIYDDDGVPITDLSVFRILHDYWDTLGGAERIEGDLGHFSFEHNGMR